jgi:hypothetical protein
MSQNTTDIAILVDRYDVAIRIGKYLGMGIERKQLEVPAGDAVVQNPEYLPPATRTVMYKGEEYGVDQPHVYIERRGHSDEDSWAVTYMNICLNSQGEWEAQPKLRNQSKEFKSRTRFGLDEAFTLCRKHGIITNDELYAGGIFVI